MSLLYLLT